MSDDRATATCAHCGAVQLLAAMVRLNDAGDYEYACLGCAKRISSERAPS